jgi:multiple sugar transport system substrate-binding protein
MSYAELTATSADYIAEFENGNCAMLPNGEWCVNMFLEDEASGECDINWQVAPMPVPDGVEDNTTWGQFQFAAITSTSEHPDEAFDFLSYLCGPEGSEVYSQCGMIHAYASDNSREAYIETAGRDSVSVFFDANKIQEAPNTTGYDQILTAFNENAQLYLLGEEDIDTCMSDFIAQRDSIKEEIGNYGE